MVNKESYPRIEFIELTIRVLNYDTYMLVLLSQLLYLLKDFLLIILQLHPLSVDVSHRSVYDSLVLPCLFGRCQLWL
jgi:hypothetical protein